MRIYILTLIFLLADFCAVKFWLVSPAQYLSPHIYQEVQAVGYVEPLSLQTKETSTSFILDCEDISLYGQSLGYHAKLRVYAAQKVQQQVGERTKNVSKPVQVPQAGKVKVTGMLQELRSFANPGGFDMESYNWVQGYGGMLRGTQVQVVEAKPRLQDYFALFNLRLRERVQQATANEAGAVLNGMVLGGSSGLSIETRDSFSANGLSHLLSVSGTHLLLLAGFLRLLLRKVRGRIKDVLLLFCLGGYACLCGLKPPILRALGMSVILLWEHGSEAKRGQILCLGALILLIYKPVWILDLGFQLSFGAAAGLIWLLPPLKVRLEHLLTWDKALSEGIAVTMAAQLATLPILVGNFYTVSLISIVSNVVLVPVLELATILTLLGMAVSFVLTPVGAVILKSAGWLVEQVLVQAGWLQSLPFSTLVIGSLPVFCAVVYYAVLLSWLDIQPLLLLTTKQKRLFMGAGMGIIMCCYLWRQFCPLPTTMYFLDVGQGDGAVVVTPRHKVVVIDTGGLTSYDTGVRILTPFLHSIGKSSVDIFIPSHGDFDHIGGAASLARNLKIARIILPQEKLTDENKALYEAILQHSKSAEVEYAQNGTTYDLGGTVLRLVDVPEQKLQGNDASTLVEVLDVKSQQKALFTGDMSSKREANLNGLPNYDVLKVGHHGSKYSSSTCFLEQVRPKLAVISCGLNNRYGHPHAAVLQRLQAIGSTIVRTDERGCVQVALTGRGIEWQGWRK